MSGTGSPGFGPGHLHAPQLDADSGFPEVTGSRPTHALALPDSKGKDIALRPREGGEPSSPSAPPASEGGSEGAPRPRTAQRRVLRPVARVEGPLPGLSLFLVAACRGGRGVTTAKLGLPSPRVHAGTVPTPAGLPGWGCGGLAGSVRGPWLPAARPPSPGASALMASSPLQLPLSGRASWGRLTSFQGTKRPKFETFLFLSLARSRLTRVPEPMPSPALVPLQPTARGRLGQSSPPGSCAGTPGPDAAGEHAVTATALVHWLPIVF